MSDAALSQPRLAFVRALCAGMNEEELLYAENSFRGVLALLAAEAADRIVKRRGQLDSTLAPGDSKIPMEVVSPPHP